MIYNLHTHTTRCKHAQGEDRAYVENAVASGIAVLGFSDHTPRLGGVGPAFCDTVRMAAEEAPGYVAAIRALEKEYAGQIRLLVGFEAEYFHENMTVYFQKAEALGVDYLILGQHLVWDGTAYVNVFAPPSDDPALHARYVDSVIEGMATGRYAYVAHPDVFRAAETPAAEREWRRLCRAAHSMDIPLEINLLGVREGRHYPGAFFWRIAGEEGCTAVLGSDAHQPSVTGDVAPGSQSREKALALAGACGVQVLEDLPRRVRQ